MDFDETTTVIDGTRLKGAARPDQRTASFIVLAGSQAGKMCKLDRGELLIGRGPDAGFRVDDDGVSRRHAKIALQVDGSVVLVDLKSTNGTFCNGQRVDSRTLQDGDRIQVGTATILKFSFQDSVEEDFQRRQYESATRDSLTECYNKKFFLERLPNELAFASRHQKLLSLAMMDIDHFKNINDTYGHLAGDHVLRVVAQLMQSTVRADDILARYGGEEFALIMRETAADKGHIAVERIRRQIEKAAITFEGQPIAITISAGVAAWRPGDPSTPEHLIQIADALLYQAKTNGRNRTAASGG